MAGAYYNNVTDSAVYSVVVSNSKGSATSQTVTLNVIPAIDLDMVPAITLKGRIGGTFRIEYMNSAGTTNDWKILADVTLTNSPEFYFDTSSIGQPSRLYRLIQLP